jgi:hypothetical protein
MIMRAWIGSLEMDGSIEEIVKIYTLILNSPDGIAIRQICDKCGFVGKNKNALAIHNATHKRETRVVRSYKWKHKQFRRNQKGRE